VKHVAFLRGINVGGKALIPMAELRECIAELGHSDVTTYIASGNVLLSSPRKPAELEAPLERAIREAFGLDVRVFVRTAAQVRRTAEAIPPHWHDRSVWSGNVIFVARDIDRASLLREFAPKDGIEELLRVPGALLWAARRETQTRSAMTKLARHPLYGQLTVRNTNTVVKLAELVQRG
jgi:uncharacterized protein (DUF1697 family)